MLNKRLKEIETGDHVFVRKKQMLFLTSQFFSKGERAFLFRFLFVLLSKTVTIKTNIYEKIIFIQLSLASQTWFVKLEAMNPSCQTTKKILEEFCFMLVIAWHLYGSYGY